MKYQANLIRDLLRAEKQRKVRTFRRIIYSVTAFGILVLALFQSTLNILYMRQKIAMEQEKLDRIEEEYKKYQATAMIINRADIELLDRLQHNRVFWTKKLAATALYLPEKYWIEKISFDRNYRVSGYGLTVPEQKQLITMDSYLNMLREDTTYNDDFPVTYLEAVVRTDEDKVERVHFELSSDQRRRN